MNARTGMTLTLLASLVTYSLGCASMGKLWHRSEVAATGEIDPEAPREYSITPSGLKYRILRKTDGPKPRASDRVTVHYKGWLDNGKVFDSSYDRNEPTTFGVREVIPGWTEGLQLVGKGGMIELEIPSELGYGARGAGADIPPNSTLHFQVELIDIR